MPQYTKKNYDPVKTSQYNREYYLKNRADKWGFKGIYGKGQSLLGGMGSTFKKYGTGLNNSARNITRNISNAGISIQNAITKTKKDFDDGISDIRNRLAAATANGRKLTKSEAAQLRSEAKQKKEEAVRRLQSAGSKLSDKEQKARANESTERAKKAKETSSKKADVSKYNEEGAKKGEAIMRLLNGEDEEKEEKTAAKSTKATKAASTGSRSSGSRGSSGSGRGNGTTANAKANKEPKDPDSLAGLSDAQRAAAKKAKARFKKQQEKEIARRRARLNDDIKKMHEVDSNGNATSGLYQKIKALQDACDRDIEKIKEKYVKKYRALLKRMRSNPDYTGSSGKTSKKKRKKGKKAAKGKVAQDTKAVKSEERKANQRLKSTT